MSMTASRTSDSTSPAAISPGSAPNGAGIASRGPGAGPDLAAALTTIDECAERMIAAAGSVRVGLATEAEREAVYRLRFRVVIDRGWADPDSMPGGQERDPDDDRALHVVAWAGFDLAATARILLPAPGMRLPLEQTFDLVVEPRGEVAHIDRVAVAPEFSHRDHRTMMALLGRTWQEVCANGLHHWAGIATAPTIRLYRMAGLAMTVLGPARPFWGEERYPVAFDAIASAPALARRWLGR